MRFFRNPKLSIYVLTFIIILMNASIGYSDGFKTTIPKNKIGKVLKILVVDDNGSREYFGDEAEEYLRQAELQTKYKDNILKGFKDSGDDSAKIDPLGTAWTKYTEISRENAYHWLSQERYITSWYKNETSSNQKVTDRYHNSQGFSASISLNTQMKDALKLKIGLNWISEVSASRDFEITIKPNKMVSMNYYPIVIKSYGKYENYRQFGTSPYETFYGTSYIPKEDQNGMPHGVYTWVEANI